MQKKLSNEENIIILIHFFSFPDAALRAALMSCNKCFIHSFNIHQCPCSFISFFLQNKNTIYHFSSLLVNSCHFQLTSTLSSTVLLVELMAIKPGCHVVSCSYWQPWGWYFSYSWCSPKGCAMCPTLFKASNIVTGLRAELLALKTN